MAAFNYDPSDGELEILQIVWSLQPVTVRTVYEHILLKKEVGYTTVLKQIQRLTEKGVLDKTIKDGVHYYKSRLAEANAKEQLAQKVLQSAFGGSAIDMVMHALGNDKAPPEELAALKTWLDQQLGV